MIINLAFMLFHVGRPHTFNLHVLSEIVQDIQWLSPEDCQKLFYCRSLSLSPSLLAVNTIQSNRYGHI